MTDLHTHSNLSDGKLTPSQLVAWAKERKVKILSLTDHDTTDGLAKAENECGIAGIKFVNGIEFSTYAKSEIHILGYNIDYLNPQFVQKLNDVKLKRIARNVELKAKLHAIGITLEIDANAEGVGRMNFARALVEQNFCANTNIAFDRFLGANGIVYTPAARLKPFEAVELIKRFDGVAVLAHPKRYLQDRNLELMLRGLIKYGLQGLEVYYPAHNETDIANLKTLAHKYQLAMTGGSDFHGDAVYNYPEFELDDFAKRLLKI